MAATVDSSLTEGHPPWLPRSYTVLDEMTSRGNAVARLIKSELQQLEGILKCLPDGEAGQTGAVIRVLNMGDSIGRDQRPPHLLGRQAPLPQPQPPMFSPDSYMASSEPVPDDFSVEDFNWQEGFTAGQLMNFADSMDVHALDWLSAEVGQ